MYGFVVTVKKMIWNQKLQNEFLTLIVEALYQLNLNFRTRSDDCFCHVIHADCMDKKEQLHTQQILMLRMINVKSLDNKKLLIHYILIVLELI